MATFIMLGKYTSESLKGISPERTDQAVDLIKKCGGEVKSIYALLGNHDLIIIVDYPGVEQAMKASIALSKLTVSDTKNSYKTDQIRVTLSPQNCRRKCYEQEAI